MVIKKYGYCYLFYFRVASDFATGHIALLSYMQMKDFKSVYDGWWNFVDQTL